MFGQTFSPEDFATIAMLVVLEGLLSLDNALVLGVLANRLEHRLRMRALSYGLIGAFVMRVVMIGAAAYLLRWEILKLLGGLYLAWVAVGHFAGRKKKKRPRASSREEPHQFWPTVAAIELTDAAFAVDSILAAVALVGPPPPGTPEGVVHPKLWVIVMGGMLGVILMRFAAAMFTYLLERFPRLSVSAYLLVLLIGIKLIVDWGLNRGNVHRVNFQDPGSAAFWVFWLAMLAGIGVGLLPGKKGDGVGEG